MAGIGGFEAEGRGAARDSGDAAEQRLAFDRDGESLPWLESDDDEDDDPGIDTRRILAVALGALALLAALAGLAWWLAHRGADRDLVADGSTIPAPAKPYKIRPVEPGGKTFAGTGDESFAVGEGETREGRIAEAAGTSPAAPPLAASAPVAAAPAEAKPDAAPEPPALSGVGVQVGAYSTRETAEAGWSRLVGTHDALKGFQHRIVEGTADIGVVYRLQAVTGDVGSANRLCAALKAEGAACQVKR